MKRVLISGFASVLMLGCLSGCAHQASAPAGPAAQTPYQKAATIMVDFSADAASAQQAVIQLHNGGAIDGNSYRIIQSCFEDIAVYGKQIDALIAAQADATTIEARVNSALASLNGIVAATPSLSAETASQIRISTQALGILLQQLNAAFGAPTATATPTATSEVTHGPNDYRTPGRAGSSARNPDLSADRGGSPRVRRSGEAAGGHPRRGGCELREDCGRFAAVAA